MTATKEKKPRTLEQAKELLRGCRRDGLHDQAFGDSEICWFMGTREIAYAYFGRKLNALTVNEDEQFAESNFDLDRAQAAEVEALGNTNSRTQLNDSGDPRFW